MSDTENDQEEQQELDLSNSDVVTKYKAAADITNAALAAVIVDVKPGAKVVHLCQKGDDTITEAVSKMFKGKSIEKGVAFPTCVSINSIIAHFSPMAEDTTELKAGDVVKIDLGSHIDGFIAVAAHTVHVQEDPSAPVQGRPADVLQAAATCLEVALRIIRPGKSIAEVSPALQKVAEVYGCTLVEGVLSHQQKQFIIDGNKCILNRPSPEHRVEDAEFEENEVYAVDVVLSTGEGKSRVKDEKETCVYKRALEAGYSLKMKASRAVFSEINKRFPTMPFTLRALDSKQSRFGLVECLNHGLLHPYPVLHAKGDELVAQFKTTVLLMPNGSDRLTALPLQKVESHKTLEDEELQVGKPVSEASAESVAEAFAEPFAELIKKLLATSLKPKKRKAKKASGGKKEEGEAEPQKLTEGEKKDVEGENGAK